MFFLYYKPVGEEVFFFGLPFGEFSADYVPESFVVPSFFGMGYFVVGDVLDHIFWEVFDEGVYG